MKHYTHDEWLAGAVLDDGVYWRESNGESVEVESDGVAQYGLRGDANGSITVRAGVGYARSYRDGEGVGNAISDRDGYGEGDAISNRDGYGEGDAISYRGGAGAGSAIETDASGTRRQVDAPSIAYTCAAGNGWLRVGCELHDLATWCRDADEIDARHGDGIAERTRALAERLGIEEVPQ